MTSYDVIGQLVCDWSKRYGKSTTNSKLHCCD